MADLAVFGASGHAKVVIDILEMSGNHLVRFVVDDDPRHRGATLLGYPVVGGRDALLARRAEIDGAIVAIGANTARLRVADWLSSGGIPLVTAVHPAAVVARGVALGAGTAVMAGVAINRDARIGANVIVNTGATIDHDCVIEDGVHLAPGCHLCGNVAVGAGSLLGVGTVVIPGIRIGRNVTVGAGATVLRDVPDGAKVAGTPARTMPA